MRFASPRPMRTSNQTAPQPSLDVLRRLLAELAANIKGQPDVLQRLSAAVRRREHLAVPPRGCRDAFLLAGPTGVGKTETARVLARYLFGPAGFVRFDCSELQTVDSVMALLGDRQGDRGRFGEAHAQGPEGVWLFDEVEKAHPKFPQLFLQMTAAGRVTLANGETLDLARHYLVVTTNLGSGEILDRQHLPFTSLEKRVVRCIQRQLSPELLGRFGAPLVFRPLTRAVQAQITELHLGRMLEWQTTQERRVTCDPAALELILQRGFSRKLGARPLLDTLDELVGNAIVLDRESGGNGSGHLVVDNDSLLLVR
jgi:ATP-dependent Clp protease ATP-binding subunit ClpA